MSELENSKTNKTDDSSNICKNKFTSNKFNPIKEASGAGVSIVTAMHVADIITKKTE